LIAATVLPGLNVTRSFKNLAVIVCLVAPTVWGVSYYLYYARGVDAFKYLLPVSELALMAVLLAIALQASGFQLPGITAHEVEKSPYEIETGIEVPRKMFLVPTVITVLGVLAGFYMTVFFRAAEKPIEPAALVQLHTHTVLLAASAVLMLLALKVLGVDEAIFDSALRISQIALPLVFLGLLVFILFGTHSIVWVLPAGIYFLLPLAVFLASIGLIATKPVVPFHSALKASMAFALAVLLILIATGAYIALRWDTSPYVTVTFRQPEGWPHVGPYYDPAKGYPGTAPARNTPRGLENAHYSPGSWLHVAVAWLVCLGLLSAGGVFTNVLNKPGLFYLFAITIPLAPFFNALGRYLAWWPELGPAAPALMVTDPTFTGAPGGIGALWYAGHPLKAFNILSLAILGLVVISIIAQKRASSGS
ncbi:MAG: hypothetical protein QXF57_00265, partial [Acidilobaceae archaeon]